MEVFLNARKGTSSHNNTSHWNLIHYVYEHLQLWQQWNWDIRFIGYEPVLLADWFRTFRYHYFLSKNQELISDSHGVISACLLTCILYINSYFCRFCTVKRSWHLEIRIPLERLSKTAAGYCTALLEQVTCKTVQTH
jgi:hypothetical protein